jgi:hypothetical protein
MKKEECHACRKEVEVHDDYEPVMCCNAWDCGCKGYPIDMLLCEKCEDKFFLRGD